MTAGEVMPVEWVQAMLRVHEEVRIRAEQKALRMQMHYEQHLRIHDPQQDMPENQAVCIVLQKLLDTDPFDFYNPSVEEQVLLQQEVSKWTGSGPPAAAMMLHNVYLRALFWLTNIPLPLYSINR